jgi:hypothetical protein
VEEGGKLFLFPDIVEDEQCARAGFEELCQVSTGAEGVAELAGVSGEVSGDL